MSGVLPLLAKPRVTGRDHGDHGDDADDAHVGAVLVPSGAPQAPWLAHLELRFASQPGSQASAPARSALVMNRHLGPLMVQKALYPEGPGVCHAVLLHPPAGVAAGDQLHIDVQVEAGAHAVLATPSATRWYKSAGVAAEQHLKFTVAAGATLEWLPEENLFYEHVKAHQTTMIEVEPEARVIAWDAFMLGRTARGEHWLDGVVVLQSRLSVGGQLKYFEQGVFRGTDRDMDGPAGLRGLRCGATLLALGPGVTDVLCEQIAAALPYRPELMAGCSHIEPGLIMMRVLGREATSVRQLLHQIWTTIRPAVTGVAAKPLRLWAC